jgi:hypothetical protein
LGSQSRQSSCLSFISLPVDRCDRQSPANELQAGVSKHVENVLVVAEKMPQDLRVNQMLKKTARTGFTTK